MKKFKVYWTAASYLIVEGVSAERVEDCIRDLPLGELRRLSGDTELELDIEEVTDE